MLTFETDDSDTENESNKRRELLKSNLEVASEMSGMESEAMDKLLLTDVKMPSAFKTARGSFSKVQSIFGVRRSTI